MVSVEETKHVLGASRIGFVETLTLIQHPPRLTASGLHSAIVNKQWELTKRQSTKHLR